MSSSPQPSRLVTYSVAAAAAGCGGAALADVTSGAFDLSFGRSGGVNFFSGYSTESSAFANARRTMGVSSVTMRMNAFQATGYADARFTLAVSNGVRASFARDLLTINSTWNDGGGLVDAGAFWNNGGEHANAVVAQVFYTYFDDTNCWTNPDFEGTKFANFKIGDSTGDIYGWIQFDWNISDGDDWSVNISNWAYSTDGPLAAGDSGSAPAVPGLGGLAALAVGAAGVRGRRQRMAG